MDRAQENKDLVAGFFEEVWNNGNLDHMDKIYTEDFRLNALWENTSLGRSGTAAKEEARGTIARWLDGFPDMHVTVEEQIADGDFVASRHVAVGTQAKEFQGIANTGKRGAVTGITINRISGDRIAEVWTCWDAPGMMVQLGVLPAPPGEGPPADLDTRWAALAKPAGGSAEETKAVVRRAFAELWSAGRSADELYAPDFTGRVPLGALLHGPQGINGFVAGWRGSVPDLDVEVHAQHAEGARCATRFTMRGTHEGFWFGVPGTGKQVSLSGIAISTVDDGRIVSEWAEFDGLGLRRQLLG